MELSGGDPLGFVGWLLSALAIGYAGFRVAARCFERTADRWIATPIISAAGLVAFAELLSLFKILNSPLLWFGAGFVAAGFATQLQRKPAIDRTPREYLRTWPVRIVAIAYVGYLILAIAIPPNTADGLSYHLPRIFHFLQRNSFTPFETPDPRESLFPIDATVLAMWTCVLTRSDSLVAVISWLSCIFGAIGVAGIAASLNFPRRLAVLAALLVLGFPQMGIQATSVLIDAVVAWFCVAAVYFTLAFAQQAFTPYAVLAAVATGLAGGSKPIAWFLAPGLALFYVLAAWRYRTLSLLNLGGMGATMLLAIVALVAPHMLRTYRYSGSWICSEPRIFVITPTARTVAVNTLRLAADAVDTNDWPYPLDGAADRLKREVQLYVPDERWLNDPESTLWYDHFGFDAAERSDRFSWFGFAGLLIILGSGVAVCWATIGVCSGKLNRLMWLGLAAMPLGHVLAHVVLLRYQPAGRFFCGSILIALPLGLLGIWRVLRSCSRRFRAVAWSLIGFLPVSGCIMTLLLNESKPLIPRRGAPAIWQLTAEEQRWRDNPDTIPLARFFADLPPLRVGCGTGLVSTDYALMGAHFQHFVTRYHDSFLDLPRAFREDHCDVIVIFSTSLNRVPAGMPVAKISERYYAVYPPRGRD